MMSEVADLYDFIQSTRNDLRELEERLAAVHGQPIPHLPPPNNEAVDEEWNWLSHFLSPFLYESLIPYFIHVYHVDLRVSKTQKTFNGYTFIGYLGKILLTVKGGRSLKIELHIQEIKINYVYCG